MCELQSTVCALLVVDLSFMYLLFCVDTLAAKGIACKGIPSTY